MKEITTDNKRLDRDRVILPESPDMRSNRFTFGKNDNQADEIAKYVETQCKGGEHVTFLEKIQSEYLFGTQYDCWNVRTNKGHYWVISPMTNLYSQQTFASIDDTLTFHIGLTERLRAQRRSTEDDRIEGRLAEAFRRWEQVAAFLDKSEGLDQIQSVGLQCRECLNVLVRSTSTLVATFGTEEQSAIGDFVTWSEFIADKIAAGPESEKIRTYLKYIASSTWELVSWLTHATNINRHDGNIAVDATEAVISAFGSAILRYEQSNSR